LNVTLSPGLTVTLLSLLSDELASWNHVSLDDVSRASISAPPPGVPVGVGVGEAVAVGVGVGDAVAVGDGDGDAVAVGDGVGEAVGVGDGDGDGEAVAVGDGDGVGVDDGDGVGVGAPEPTMMVPVIAGCAASMNGYVPAESNRQ
jgi:hypothetical protein